MKFQRLVFRRGQQALVLRCTKHADKPEHYAELVAEMNTLREQGFSVLVEGIGSTKEIPADFSSNERRIADVLNALFDLVHVQKTLPAGLVSQKLAVKYHKDVIKADLPFVKCVQFLHDKGVRIPFWLPLCLKSRWGQSCMQKGIQYVARDLKESNGYTAIKFLFTHPISVVLAYGLKTFNLHKKQLHDHRNNIAVAKVEQCAQTTSILLHFGKKHKEGLAKLLAQTGWVLERVND